MKIEIRTLQDTARLAQRLAALLKGRHALITLSGDLGAERRHSPKRWARRWESQRPSIRRRSPFRRAIAWADGGTLFHIDAYRLEGDHAGSGV